MKSEIEKDKIDNDYILATLNKINTEIEKVLKEK